MPPTPKPTGPEPNRERDLITRMREEMTDLLALAHVAEEHTATPGWRNLYAGRMAANRSTRRQLAGELRDVADDLETGELRDREAMKPLSKTRTAMGEQLDLEAAFLSGTVAKVIEPVHAMRALADKYTRTAAQDEERAPLVLAGLVELMREALAEFPVPTFDHDTGAVTLDAR